MTAEGTELQALPSRPHERTTRPTFQKMFTVAIYTRPITLYDPELQYTFTKSWIDVPLQYRVLILMGNTSSTSFYTSARSSLNPFLVSFFQVLPRFRLPFFFFPINIARSWGS